MAARRGRRALIVLLVLVVVLVGLFVAVDRVAVYAAEATIAKQAEQELADRNISAPHHPKVSIAGFPFLTQVARGRYDKITIEVADPSSSGIAIDDLLIVATGVHADTGALLDGTGDVTADRVTGTARIGWDSVADLIDLSGFGGGGATVTALSDGRVQITAPIEVDGLNTDVTATGSFELADSSVRVKIDKIDAGEGDVPPALQRLMTAVERELSFTIRVPRLPYDLKLVKATARPDGVMVTAAASDVPLRSGG